MNEGFKLHHDLEFLHSSYSTVCRLTFVPLMGYLLCCSSRGGATGGAAETTPWTEMHEYGSADLRFSAVHSADKM